MPVWVAAAAKSATQALLGQTFLADQTLVLPDETETIIVPVRSAALTSGGEQATAITVANSGIALDITRDLEVWVCVKWSKTKPALLGDNGFNDWLDLKGGFGVGKYKSSGQLCLSGFAKELLEINLRPFVASNRTLKVEIIFPAGKALAKRTSNESFGVVEGLAVIGTQSTANESASSEQLRQAIDKIRDYSASSSFEGEMLFVIGENGFDLAHQLGLSVKPIIKTGNWIGPLIVAAAEVGVTRLLILGYHGKLIKLAGGIFHTHHHLADGRMEIFRSLALEEQLPLEMILTISKEDSLEDALLSLESIDKSKAESLWQKIAIAVEQRSRAYVNRYSSMPIEIGSSLFDRKRQLRWAGPCGLKYLGSWGVTLKN